MDERRVALIDDLRGLAAETEWVEHKANNADAEMIGRLVSAVSNGARMAERSYGYVIWGIADDTRDVIGTTFRGSATRKENQPLPVWLSQMTEPCPDFEFLEVAHPKGRVVVLEVPAASVAPTKFKGVPYIRVGEATVKLSGQPQREQKLWSRLQASAWEAETAMEFLAEEQILQLLNVDAYYRLLKTPKPSAAADVMVQLRQDRLIAPDAGGRWRILNLGACLLANRLSTFPRLARKAMRIIHYVGKTRVNTKREHLEDQGYAAGFEVMLEALDEMLPKQERIGRALREETSPYPQLAIRELVANALIHQAFGLTGRGPMIEVFDDRIEITNPGAPLIDTDRFLDMPPRSRNEALASLMRRMSICEERGSGIDKVISGVEDFMLPAPNFHAGEDFTRVTMLAPRSFAAMTTAERVRACYQHAALHWAGGERVTNASLRKRFGIETGNAAQMSRVFSDAKKAGLIKLADPDAPKGGYAPFWA
ncbi:MAG: putative DNA binding domain-containing protein [Hyphomonadaceae bacterium]|nr:putative DNA binding domain-containing protein [Hyphomonadaceae bacterium]